MRLLLSLATVVILFILSGVLLIPGKLKSFQAQNVHGHEEEHHENTHDNEHDGEHEHEGVHSDNEVTIKVDAAKRAGVKIEPAGQQIIKQRTTLTGRIILNRDKTFSVRARFPGIVKDVRVKWGQKVKKDQILASVESNESLKTYNVLAPHDGIILERKTNIGDVTRDAPVFVIADLSVVWAEFHIFPRDLPKIKLGQKVQVQALDNGNDVYSSSIVMMLPTADVSSQTILAIVPLPNQNGRWRPGITVEGSVISSEHVAKVAVKVEAIQQLENKSVVFIREGTVDYKWREVRLGKSDGKYIEVLSGLTSGEEVVSSNSFTIKAEFLKGSAEHNH